MACGSNGHGSFGSELPPSSADSQPRAADQLKGRHDLSSETVFRLHILGKWGWNKSQIDGARVEQLVRKAFGVTPDARIIIKSLADHPVRQALVATLNFSQIPTKISQSSVSLQEFNETIEDLSLDLDTHFHGFTPLHCNTSSGYTSDLIALSGLGGHAFGSFKRRGGDFMWLRDDLPVSMPDARVFVYGYDTGLQGSASFQSLEDLGLSFKDALTSLLKENWRSGFLKPLVLLGHSLGGLVVKEALCQMFTNSKVDEELLLKSIRAILFFGTPNQGMDITSLIPMVEGQPNEDFLRSLSTDSADLRRQAQQWSKAFDSTKPRFISDKLEITSYYETSASRTAVKVGDKWTMSGPPAKLVDRFSATHGRPWERDERFVQPIDRDHSGLVKFRSRNDPVYVNHVLPRLQTYLCDNEHRQRHFHTTEAQNFDEKQKATCLKSLDFPDRTSRQDQITAARNNTCKWLLEHQEYTAWLQRREGLLWLEGHPGSGKSTLTKHAVEAMEDDTPSQNVVLTHFFHGRGSELQKSALGLFRSLAYQLLDKLPTYCTEIMSKHHTLSHQSSQESKSGEKSEQSENPPINWKQEWLHTFLEKHLLQVAAARPIIVFIDALDECEHEARHYLADFFAEAIRDTAGASLKIFVSCRHYPNLFSEGSRIQTTANNMQDIAVFVESKLQVVEQVKRSLLASEIIDNSRGNFQWAKIVTIESVKFHRKGRTTAEIQENIRRLPKDIHELYDSLFEDADHDDLQQAHRLFHWLCFSRRPLCIRELQYVIMLSPDTTETSISEIRNRADFKEELSDMINFITDVSRGLAEVLTSKNLDLERSGSTRQSPEADSNKEDLSPTWASSVQLIHQTVTDYLLDTGLQTLEGNRHKFSRGQSVYFIIRSCLRYVAMDDFGDQTQSISTFKHGADLTMGSNALRYYISRFLLEHLREAESAGVNQSDFIVSLGWPYKISHLTNFSVALHLWRPLIETMLLSGDSSPKYSPWSDTDYRTRRRYPRSHNDYWTLLSWAARSGLASIVRSLIQRKFGQSQEENCQRQDHLIGATPPLESISWKGQKIFLDGYFNVNLRCPSTALHGAVSGQHVSVVRELLQSPMVDPNVQDEDGKTPLHVANCREGEVARAVVKHLLAHAGINTRLQDRQGSVPIFDAVLSRDLEILQMNIDADGACVNSKNFVGDTPLAVAARAGFVDVVQLFINYGHCTRENLQYAYRAAWPRKINTWTRVYQEKCLNLLLQTGLVETIKEANPDHPSQRLVADS